MLANLIRRAPLARSVPEMGLTDYFQLWERFGYANTNYIVPNDTQKQITAFEAMRNPIVYAALVLRMMCLSEIDFVFTNRVNGKATREFNDGPGLTLLRTPYPGAQLGELASRMEADAFFYGNSYWYQSAPNEVTWIDPTHVEIMTGDRTGPEGGYVGKFLAGYRIKNDIGMTEEIFLPGEIVHYRPIPDPTHPFRGVSWLSALLPDITRDRDLTTFVSSFLNNSATPNLIVSLKEDMTQEAFDQFIEKLEARHVGPAQGFKTLYLGAGVDVTAVGNGLKDFKLEALQSYGETRIAAAAHVPPALLNISEGLQGSTLNSGNYAAVRRRFSDMLIVPLWGKMCGALEPIARPRKGQMLWYDTRDVAFLRTDVADQANIRKTDAATIVNLRNGGFTPESAIEAVIKDDLNLLKDSGILSVQLQAPIDPNVDDNTDNTDSSDSSTETPADGGADNAND